MRLEEDESVGIEHTAGFIQHCGQTGMVCTHTHNGCGYCGYGYGYGYGISDLWVTRAKCYTCPESTYAMMTPSICILREVAKV